MSNRIALSTTASADPLPKLSLPITSNLLAARNQLTFLILVLFVVLDCLQLALDGKSNIFKLSTL